MSLVVILAIVPGWAVEAREPLCEAKYMGVISYYVFEPIERMKHEW